MGEPNRRFSFPNLVRRLPQIWRGRPAEVERPQTSTLRNESAQATVSPSQEQRHGDGATREDDSGPYNSPNPYHPPGPN
ncbi:unnamed protein product [Adineta steineri]|uniref:Uncharacterized protein n=1 Tax=Adineta steineri TaxID=433720 RepID=A0A814V947_9BILA|nr:unnamed protein product [Adineta steineri]